jgi:hypothetical protein
MTAKELCCIRMHEAFQFDAIFFLPYGSEMKT